MNDKPGPGTPLANALSWRASIWARPEVDTGPVEGGWTRLDKIFDDEAALEDWLAYEGSFTPSLDRRGRAAYLIADYCNLLCSATVPIFMTRGIVPDLRPSEVAIRYIGLSVVHQGQTLEERRYSVRFLCGGVRQSDSFDPDPTEIRENFRQSFEGHLEILMGRLNRLTRLSRSAMWRLAGDSIGAAFLDAGQRLNDQEKALEHAMAILKAPGSPLRNRQLHFFDITVADPKDSGRVITRTFRARGGCCRYYLAEGGSLCSTCVLKNPLQRDSDLADAMRRFLEDSHGGA